jgi:hypothetical protein
MKRTRTVSPAVIAGLAKARAARAAKAAVAIPDGDARPHGEGEPRTPSFVETTFVIAKPAEHVFFSAGDLGDIIALLPSIRHMGGGHIVIGEREKTGTGPGYCRESMKGDRFDAIKPLLEAQSYVRSVSWGDCPDGAHDMSFFRHTPPRRQENIATWQARHLGLQNVSLEKWLNVPNPIPGPVVFARSARYHNPRFPIHGYCDRYNNAVFVGSAAEHQAFEEVALRKIPHRKTADLLELARVLAGAERVISNQTCAWWIAAGLDRPLVQETCPEDEIQNSIISRPHFFFIGRANQMNGITWH